MAADLRVLPCSVSLDRRVSCCGCKPESHSVPILPLPSPGLPDVMFASSLLVYSCSPVVQGRFRVLLYVGIARFQSCFFGAR